MDLEQQRFIIKYFWMTGWDVNKIKTEFQETLGAEALGRSQIKVWLARFEEGDIAGEPNLRRPKL
jgi:hypothetical protein